MTNADLPEGASLRSVAETVKSGDRDRYWSALFAPPELRADLLALYAFNIEVARIPYLVSEPMVGQIRLQWWRDAIDLASAETRTANPVADALAQAISRHELPKQLLQTMIEARLFDIYTEPMSGLPALKTYVLETAGAVFALSCQILGARGDQAERAAESAGMAYGVTALLRALPVHAASGRRFLPVSGIETAIATMGEGSGPDSTSALLRQELKGMRSLARQHLARFREEWPALPQAVRPAFLVLSLVEPALAKMERESFRPLQDIADLPPLYRLWRLWRSAAFGSI